MNNSEKQEEKEDTTETSTKYEPYFKKSYELPCILQASWREVMINKNNLNEFEYVQPCFHKDMIKTDKLILKSYGDWDIDVYSISTQYFNSREEFDNLIIDEKRRKEVNAGNSFKIISIKDAFNQLNVKLKVNLDYFFRDENKHEYQTYIEGDYDIDYYEWCWNEMKKLKANLGRKKRSSSEQYSHLKGQIKKIKSILMFNLIKEIFGNKNDESNEDENIFNLKDFKLLCYDGNFRYASALNGENYLGFVYVTS